MKRRLGFGQSPIENRESKIENQWPAPFVLSLAIRAEFTLSTVRVNFVAIPWLVWGYLACGALPVWWHGRRGISALVLAGLVSFLILFLSAFLLTVRSQPLTRTAWLVGTLILSGAGCLFPRQPVVSRVHVGSPIVPRVVQVILLFAVMGAGVAIVYRAMAQPLTGFDTAFRWDFLARQIVTQRGLSFYPPLSDADFQSYMWPDSIPPLVSLLYAWSYLSAGSLDPVLTAPAVLLVVFLLFAVVATFAASLGGALAGRWACALLASSAVQTWAVSMGQETGLIALGVLVMVWSATNDREEGMDWMMAGVGGAVAALTRDYGVLIIPVVALGCWLMRRRAIDIGKFLLVVVAIAGPWYVRTWLRTGNPFYNQEVFGLFPVNEMQAGLMQMYTEDMGFAGHWKERLTELSRFGWALGPLLVVAGAGGFFVQRARATVATLTALAWVLVWAWSVGYTSGGLSYSLRVLGPVLAILAVWGGAQLASLRSYQAVAAAGVILLLSVEASIRSLLTLASPRAVPAAIWLTAANSQSALRGDAAHDRLAAAIGRQGVLVQSVYEHAFLTNRGVNASPPWSPKFQFLTQASAEVAATELRARGIRFVIISTSADLASYFGRYPLFRDIAQVGRPVLTDRYWTLVELSDPKESKR